MPYRHSNIKWEILWAQCLMVMFNSCLLNELMLSSCYDIKIQILILPYVNKYVIWALMGLNIVVVWLWMAECAQDKYVYFDGLMRGCGSSSALSMELLRSCTESSECGYINAYIYTYTNMPIFYMYMCMRRYMKTCMYIMLQGCTYILVYE